MARSPDETLDRVTGSLMNVFNTYQGQKDAAQAEAVLKNPKSTPLEQAMALAKIGNKELANEVYKGSVKEATTAAKSNNLAQIEQQLQQNLGMGTTQNQPRDRSWVPDMTGRTPGIRDASNDNATQPGAEGTGSTTQPGFSVNGPQNASRNQTALNTQAPNPNMSGSPNAAPAAVNQEVPLEQQASAYERAAQAAANEGNHPVATQYANKAKQLRDDIRADKKSDKAMSKEQIKENRTEIAKAFSLYSDFGAIDKLEKDLEEAEDLILNKDVSLDTNVLGSALAAIAEGKESGVADLFKTKDQQKLFSVLRSSLKPKTEGGSNPSTREVLLSMSAIPSYMKSKEANAYIVGNLLEDVRLNKVRAKIMNDLRKDPNMTAPEFYEQVQEKMRPYLEQSRENTKTRNGLLTATSQVADKSPSPGHLFMYDPKSGDVFEAPLEDRQLLESQKSIVLPSRRSR